MVKKGVALRPTKKRQRWLVFIMIFIVACIILVPVTFAPGSLDLLPKSTVITLLKFGNNISQDDPSLVHYVKEDILVQPAPLNKPYNFSSVSSGTPINLDNPSEYKQNLIVLEIFKQINKTNKGFFVEFGALDGIETSNTLYFERSFNWTGLLVEPDADIFEVLKNANRKAWSANSCLSPKSIPELLKLPKRGYYHTSEGTMKIQCFPLYTFLLAMGNVSVVDYFSLDFNGFELRILQSIPYDKIKFMVIEVKVAQNKNLVKSFLESKGYTLYQYIYQHSIFIHGSLKSNVTFPKANNEDAMSGGSGKRSSIWTWGIFLFVIFINLNHVSF